MWTSCHLTFFFFFRFSRADLGSPEACSYVFKVIDVVAKILPLHFQLHRTQMVAAYLIATTKLGRTSKRRQKGNIKTCCIGGATFTPASAYQGLGCLSTGSRLTVLCEFFIVRNLAQPLREWLKARAEDVSK